MKNLIIRTVTGLVFVAIIVLPIVLRLPTVIMNLFLLVTCLGMYEYRSILMRKDVKLSLLFYGAGIVIYGAFYACFLWKAIHLSMLIGIVMTALFLLVSVELFRKREQPFTHIAYAVWGIIWIVIPFSLIALFLSVKVHDIGAIEYLLLMLFVFIWFYDTMAYCIGSLIGKHRLCERISPKKSWEGAIGAAVLTLIFSAVIPQFLSLNVWQWVGFAAITVVFGTVGDLTQSLFKRQFEVKDSGGILPGHGGILDRFDSFLFATPLVLFYLYIFVFRIA